MSILDGIKNLFVPKTSGTAETSETTETKQAENVESKEAKELASAKTNEDEMADVEISEGEETNESKGGLLKRVVDEVDEVYNSSDSKLKHLGTGLSYIAHDENFANKVENFTKKAGSFFKGLFSKK